MNKYPFLLADIKKHLNEACLVLENFPSEQKQLGILKFILCKYENDEQKTLRRIYDFLYDRSPAGYQDLYRDKNRSLEDIETLQGIHSKIHNLLSDTDKQN